MYDTPKTAADHRFGSICKFINTCIRNTCIRKFSILPSNLRKEKYSNGMQISSLL